MRAWEKTRSGSRLMLPVKDGLRAKIGSSSFVSNGEAMLARKEKGETMSQTESSPMLEARGAGSTSLFAISSEDSAMAFAASSTSEPAVLRSSDVVGSDSTSWLPSLASLLDRGLVVAPAAFREDSDLLKSARGPENFRRRPMGFGRSEDAARGGGCFAGVWGMAGSDIWALTLRGGGVGGRLWGLGR